MVGKREGTVERKVGDWGAGPAVEMAAARVVAERVGSRRNK